MNTTQEIAVEIIDLMCSDPNDCDELIEIIKQVKLDQERITIEALIDDVSDVLNDYDYTSMGCGLEDVNIVDRYEAMRHGFEAAVTKVEEAIKNTKTIEGK